MNTSRKRFFKIAASSAAALAGTASFAAAETKDRSADYNVRAYGAAGDGVAKDTEAIQKTIDVCAENGGGTVRVPPGNYLTGTIVLKSRINLHLEEGAVILGSPERSDYSTEYSSPNRQHTGEIIRGWNANSGPEHLIVAMKETDVAITGLGTINGQGTVFWGEDGSGNPPIATRRGGWRPMRMVAFVECRNVIVQDVSFIDATGWSLYPFGCDTVAIRGITIRSHGMKSNGSGMNTDGIDVDCSRNVRISDCYIDTGDDSIAIKSTTNRLSGRTVPCENISVTNCYLSSHTNAIRVGYEGDAPIRNCTFSNLTISNTRCGLNMLVAYNPKYGVHHGPTIENILFQNIAMDVGQAFYLAIRDKASHPGCIRNVVFSDITAKAGRASGIHGSQTIPVENVRFDNVDITMTGEMDDSLAQNIPDPYSIWGYWKTRGLPYGFFCRYARDISFRGVKLAWKDITGQWRGAIRCDEVDHLDLDGVTTGAPSDSTDFPVVHLNNVRNSFVRGCRLDRDSNIGLKIDGSESSSFTVVGNDLSQARNPVVVGETVPDGILFQQANRIAD